MIKFDVRPTVKQEEAWDYLFNKTTKYVVFGGAAGSGKSWLICEWLIWNCYKYPGSKWFVGRDELKKIMSSVFVTFTKVVKHHKIPATEWKLNGQYNYIEFKNGSRIDLLDLKLLPTDPMFERFGSLEYTGGAIEEAGEIHANAFEILKSRIGRHMNDVCPPKILITCNPKKNWLYYDFYLPYRDNKLPSDSAFIPANYKDNKYTAEVYGEQLSNLRDQVMKQRLMFGNWEYDDSKDQLLSYSEIVSIFSNDGERGGKYITIDPAFQGKDTAVILVWDGYIVETVVAIPKIQEADLRQYIDNLIKLLDIPRRNVDVDAAGNGSFLPSFLKGIRGFIGGSSPLKNKEARYDEMVKPYYNNLRTQCIFEMAHKIKVGRVRVNCNEEVKAKLIQEIEQWRVKEVDTDKKVSIIGKDEIKENIGRSTDYSDALYMRCFFDLDLENKTINTEIEKKQIQQYAAQPFNKWSL